LQKLIKLTELLSLFSVGDLYFLTLVLKAQLNKLHRLLASVSDFPVSVAKITVTLDLVAIVWCMSEDAKSMALRRGEGEITYNI